MPVYTYTILDDPAANGGDTFAYAINGMDPFKAPDRFFRQPRISIDPASGVPCRK